MVTDTGYFMYTLTNMIDMIIISVLHDIIKIWEESGILNMSKTYILHNNNNNIA